MAKEPEREDLSPQDMRNWLQQEITDLAKALELRAREATALVAAYTAGEISAAQTAKRLSAYDHRWGEALPGTHAAKGVSDEQILSEIDEARHPQFAERLIAEGRQRSGKQH